MKVSELTNFLSAETSLFLQEEYDNSGLQVGKMSAILESAILAVDVTEDVVNEAIEAGAGIVISHHPLIFNGLKSITGSSSVERIVAKAIKNDIAIYAAHTNLDVIKGGVSYKMAEKIGLKNIRPLSELQGKLVKVVVFVPVANLESVKNAMYKAGAGATGNYDHCSFNVHGEGTFRPLTDATPYSGEVGSDHMEKEVRVEMILPDYLKVKVVDAMIKAHPYEEVAYDIYRLENGISGAGFGSFGDMEKPISGIELLSKLAITFDSKGVRYSGDVNKNVTRVALCGGSGGSLIGQAHKVGADIFITGDIKYHSFFETEKRMIIADIGHYESEKFSIEILYDIITKKFPKFAVRFSKHNTNPINYM